VKPGNRESRSKPAISAAREAAFDILLRVERDSAYAFELLHSRTCASLSSVDHGLATELVMGVLRWRSLVDSRIAQASSLPLRKLDLEVLIALRLAVYQLGWLSRIPPRAAIHESVALVKRARKRSAAPFANAVLRKIAILGPDTAQPTPSPVEALAESTAHPPWLVKRWVQAYGTEAAAKICQYDQSTPTKNIRLRSPEAEGHLRSEGILLAPGSLLASARLVQSAAQSGEVTQSTALRKKECVIQDEASQLVAYLVGRGKNILDCCAAPGGKTLVLADRNPQSNVIAVDVHPHRVRLSHNLLRTESSSARSVEMVAADARALPLTGGFDRVLADVPCSGTGTLSRNPEIKWRLKPEDLADLQGRQLAILRAAMNQVAAGGRLIYSTCSLEQEENEDVIELALRENSPFQVIECGDELARLQREGELIVKDPSSLTHGPYLRTLPGVHACDGFFAAILEKNN
jgi:16S rRNA (cytosine967-C5)-methyltransferase